MLRNKDNPASTWFGGTPFRPRALRVRPSTTKILVKLVISSRIDGATESRVSSSRMLTDVLGLGLMSRWTVPDGAFGPAGAVGPAGASFGTTTDLPVLAGSARVRTP